MSVAIIKSAAEYNTAKNESGLVVIDFFATWCPPCRMIAPKFEGWAKEYVDKNVMFFKLDVDQVEEVVMQERIESMPTFLFFKDGKLVEKIEGANQSRIMIALETHLN